MTYVLSKEPPQITTLWTEEEKIENLRALFGRHTLLLPDDGLYTPAVSADDLEDMARPLKRQLGLRTRKIGFSFSSEITRPGLLRIDGTAALVTISSRYLNKPYKCAAIIAHNLCHYSLMVRHKTYFDDSAENEKLADLATIYAGLGLVMLNGTGAAGWRGLVRRFIGRDRDVSGGLVYLKPRRYASYVTQYIDMQHAPMENIANHMVPWAASLPAKPSRRGSAKAPSFIITARRQHARSLERFAVCLLIIFGFVLIGLYINTRRPAFLSEELRVQKQKVDGLFSSYAGCAERVEEKRRQHDTSDQSIQRVIDAELTACKSLENRYNHEVDVYNRLRDTYDHY